MLAVASFIPAQFRYPTSLCSPNEKIRRDSVAYIQDSIKTAVALGAPVVSVCPGHTLYGQSFEDGMGCLSESLGAIAEFAARYVMRDAIDKLFHVHIDDNNGLRDQHLVPGEGSFDFPSFLADLGEVGYAGLLAVELGWDYTIEPDSAARLTVERMQKIKSHMRPY